MLRRVKIGPMRLKWVLRHIWEKDRDLTNHTVWSMRRKPELGIWFNKSQAVGPVKKGNDRSETVSKTFTKSNLVNVYQIGFNLVVCQIWFEFQFKPTFGLKT